MNKGKKVKVHIISRFTGKLNTMNLPVTDRQIRRWKAGESVNKVFPHLSPVERIFLRTGMSEAEQKEYYNLTN